MITIESVQNGWIVTEVDDLDDHARPAVRVIEESDDGPDEVDAAAVQNLLWLLIDLLGVGGSRYDAQRVRIVVEPGDKHGDDRDEAPAC